MKTPTYETSAGALAALLATRQFHYCALFKFDLVGGSSLYYTSSDVPVTFGGNTYQTAKQSGVIVDRKGSKARVKWRIGVEVDTLEFDVIPNGGTVNGQDFLSAIRQGVFDGAICTFYHAYWTQTDFVPLISPTGVVTMFAGRVAQVQAGRSLSHFTVNSHLDLLNIQLPRNIYQSGCINTLYDTGCTLNKASFGVSATVSGVTSESRFNAVLSQAIDYFSLGVVTFTSGANAGLSRTVKSWGANTFVTLTPFPNLPVIGDAFTAYPGCDKKQATCAGKFSNQANFRGFPYIPENTTGV